MNKNNFRRLARILLPALAVTVLLGLAAKYQTSTSPFAALVVPPPSASAAPAPVCVPILLYHSVLSDSARAGDYVVSPAVFRADMDYLRSHGYTAVFLSQLYAYETAGTPLPEKPVVITLDDGYLNNLTNVLPILRETDMKAVISVVGEFVQRCTDNGDRTADYACLTWNDIRSLSDSGLVEIGSHTWGMHGISEGRRGCTQMAGESDGAYRLALTADLSRLQMALRHNAGVTPTVFAYPYGFVSGGALPVLKSLGFTAALTCEKRLNYLTGNPEELYNLGRFNRPSGISTEDFMRCLTP